VRKRAAIFVSKSDHCLLDLLWRRRHGGLDISIPMVISNHPDTAEEVRSFGVPFFHVPSSGPDKSAAEAEHLRLLAGNVDFVVLARHMQILSDEFIEIERHHPGTGSLRLPPEVAGAWKQRLRTYTAADGTTRKRKHYLVILSQVRSFYLDIQEWAMEDPSWAQWAAPSPVRRAELTGMEKARRKTVAQMHQRVRERLPHLQRLADSAAAHRTAMSGLLQAASAAWVGEEFTHEGTAYRRTLRKSYLRDPTLPRLNYVVIEDTATGQQADVTDTRLHPLPRAPCSGLAARDRLIEIIKNLADRIAEARINGWLGEVEGLQVSLTAARAKLATLDRTARNTTPGTADLGMPAFHLTRQETP